MSARATASAASPPARRASSATMTTRHRAASNKLVQGGPAPGSSTRPCVSPSMPGRRVRTPPQSGPCRDRHPAARHPCECPPARSGRRSGIGGVLAMEGVQRRCRRWLTGYTAVPLPMLVCHKRRVSPFRRLSGRRPFIRVRTRCASASGGRASGAAGGVSRRVGCRRCRRAGRSRRREHSVPGPPWSARRVARRSTWTTPG